MTYSTEELRKRALEARRKLSPGERTSASETICRRVCELHAFKSAHTVACFLPMADEVDVRDIIARAWRTHKRTFVPVVRGPAQMVFCEIDASTELRKSRFGIWEPARGFLIDAKNIDVVVTPTVAFDDARNRIGMGSAYYDRCFAHLKHRKQWLRPKLVGVAFDCQKVEKIVPNPWDIRLYRVITEKT